MSDRKNLWQGEWINDKDIVRRLEQLDMTVQEALAQPLNVEVVLEACSRLSVAAADSTFAEISSLLGRDRLEQQLCRELGTDRPIRLGRPNPRAIVFEAWAPVGLIVHLTSSPLQTVLSTVEGLLTGNVNLVMATHPPMPLLAELGSLDPTHQIARRIVVLHESAEKDQWRHLACAAADCVATWERGDVSSYLPAGGRLVRREDKISIAYLTSHAWLDKGTLAALVNDIFQLGHHAPRAVYLDTDLVADVQDFADRFNDFAATVCPVRIDRLPRDRLTAALRPMRPRLWSVYIAGEPRDVADLSRKILVAGARRVATIGATSDSTEYEPNDGSYSLLGYCRRVTVQADERFATNACLDEFMTNELSTTAVDLQPAKSTLYLGRPGLTRPDTPVLTKVEAKLRTQMVASEYAQLYFHSGGSTGTPAVSIYTYADYDANNRATADGLLAAGLDPRTDRAANLFPSSMGGGLVSFFETLERLTVTQIPIGGNTDLRSTMATLLQHRIDTLIGMPSYLWRLCRQEEANARSYGGIRKIFYTGEHISVEQRRWLQHELGVEVIRSAAYTTTDLGPLGYQCTYATGTVHHLHADLHILEILDLETDRPAEYGRLIFTRKTRRGQDLERYEIGDVGRWVYGECECLRRTPRFELLGRRGDLMRVATRFINYRRLEEVAQAQLGYAGEVQIVLDFDDDRERLTIRLDESFALDLRSARHAFVTNYPDLRAAVETEQLLRLVVEAVDSARLHRTSGGKLRRVVDLRSRA